jgi:sarcosine oxidase, subunit gamma
MSDPLSTLPLRRSPLRRTLDTEGAAWRAINDSAIADLHAHNDDAQVLGIADLSPLPRIGFKGRGTIAGMSARGVVVEATPNKAFRQPDGGLCLVLAPGEVILLSNLAGDGQRLKEMAETWKLEDTERTYPLLRQDSHAWFRITGVKAPSMFAKICAIDLRPEKFPDLSIAQTSVAKISAIVVRADAGHLPAYHVLADSASALYFFDCLRDAAQEFGGQTIGHKAVQDLESS